MVNTKFIMTLDREVYIDLGRIAKENGISVQELMRARIISDWLHENYARKSRTK